MRSATLCRKRNVGALDGIIVPMTTVPQPTRPPRRGARALLAALTVTVVALSGCSSSGGSDGGSSASPTPTTTPVTVKPANAKSGDVAFGKTVTLKAAKGHLKSMTVTSKDGHDVAGHVAKGGATWQSADPIKPDTTWKWSAVGTNGTKAKGRVSATKATAKEHATVNIARGQTVGIAAPIIVNFQSTVKNKANLERHMTVQMRRHGSKGKWEKAKGSWAWMIAAPGTEKAHFRPKKFWPAHTDVRVDLPLGTLNWGGGATGRQDITMRFTVGRSQIVKADAKKHNIVVYRDGHKVHTYPASYGMDSVKDRNTRSGIHVVTEKYETKQMKSERWGYNLKEHWAVRINNNGEFIHANPATTSSQGSRNVSHGCINLSTTNARAYYQTAIYGDPVVVTGTGTKLSNSLTELYDWALTWQKWKSLSALS